MVTTRILVVNCDSASATPDHVAAVLRLALAQSADIVLACELDDVRAENVDSDNTYDWLQYGERKTPESGCAIGVRKGFALMTEHDIKIGSDATSEGSWKTGSGIRTRFILRARVTLPDGATHTIEPVSFRVAVGHAAPDRAPKTRAEFMRRFARVRAKFKGGDYNLRRRLAARAIGRRVVGFRGGVLWLAMPRFGWQVVSRREVELRGDDFEADHPAVLVTVRKKPSKKTAGQRARLAEIPI